MKYIFFTQISRMHFPLFLISSLFFLGTSPLFTFAEELPKKDITLTAGPLSYILPLSQIEAWHRAETRSESTQGYVSEWENIKLCNTPFFWCDAFLLEREKSQRKTTTTFFLMHEKIQTYLEDLQKQSDRDSTVSTLATKEEFNHYTFIRGQEGIRLSVEKNIPLLESIVQSPLSYTAKPTALETELSPPSFSPEAKALDITALLAEGTSNFSGSSVDRIFNITHALERFDGILIKPGEIFSFTETLGPVEDTTGYRPELVIRNNKTEPEFGGGICQVSTTFFRAAVNAGLEILDRRNHSYPVKYYLPIGFDATVYYPRPDLRLKNNFTHNILFVPTISGKQLTFSVYGTSDNRKVTVTLPITTEKNPDGSLKTEFTQTVTDAQGNPVLEKVFKSTYDSPSKYPHPGDIAPTEKPKDWSKKQWEAYKKAKGL